MRLVLVYNSQCTCIWCLCVKVSAHAFGACVLRVSAHVPGVCVKDSVHTHFVLVRISGLCL